MWGIHTRDDAMFKNESVIAIGWPDFGNLRAFGNDREAMKNHYIEVFTGRQKPGAFAVCSCQLYRFAYDMQIGDYVVHPSKVDRMINIGKITGDYEYKPEALKPPFDYVQQRKVEWLVSLPRTSFSQAAYGTEVSYANAQPGDVIYYGGHVGIYIGNGQIVHASTAKTGIKYSSATYRTIITVRRFL